MRIFVAGATGVIGRRVIPQLVDGGHLVTAIGRTPEKRQLLNELGATAVTVDLFDAAQVRAAVDGHDVVINVATKIPPASRALLPGAWRENDRIRSIASRNLADAATRAGAERFIQESFAPIYPDRGDEWIDETVPVQPAKYNRSVLDAERSAQRFTESKTRGIVLRFSFFYGPDSDFTRDIIKMVKKGWAPALGSPEGFISSISHDDAASAVIAALGARAGVYNVTDDEPVRRREFFDLLAQALGVGPPRFPPSILTRVAGSKGDALSRSQRMSNRKLKSETGWTPVYPSVREGWKAMLAVMARDGLRSD